MGEVTTGVMRGGCCCRLGSSCWLLLPTVLVLVLVLVLSAVVGIVQVQLLLPLLCAENLLFFAPPHKEHATPRHATPCHAKIRSCHCTAVAVAVECQGRVNFACWLARGVSLLYALLSGVRWIFHLSSLMIFLSYDADYCTTWLDRIIHQEEEQERVRREFEAQLEAVSQLELLQKEERAR